MFNLSFWEISVILVVALIALGPKRLPELLKMVGKGMREVRRASNDLRDALEEPLEEIRKPLEEIREGLDESVRGAEREIEAELNRDDDDGIAEPLAGRLQTREEAMKAIDSALTSSASPNRIGAGVDDNAATKTREADTGLDPYLAAADSSAVEGKPPADPAEDDAGEGPADEIDDETLEDRDRRFAEALGDDGDTPAVDDVEGPKLTAS